jgi:hypothetical protein
MTLRVESKPHLFLKMPESAEVKDGEVEFNIVSWMNNESKPIRVEMKGRQHANGGELRFKDRYLRVKSGDKKTVRIRVPTVGSSYKVATSKVFGS